MSASFAFDQAARRTGRPLYAAYRRLAFAASMHAHLRVDASPDVLIDEVVIRELVVGRLPRVELPPRGTTYEVHAKHGDATGIATRVSHLPVAPLFIARGEFQPELRAQAAEIGKLLLAATDHDRVLNKDALDKVKTSIRQTCLFLRALDSHASCRWRWNAERDELREEKDWWKWSGARDELRMLNDYEVLLPKLLATEHHDCEAAALQCITAKAATYQEEGGATALFAAVAYDLPVAIVAALLAHGADPHAKDTNGWNMDPAGSNTPLSRAKRDGQHALVRAMEEHLAACDSGTERRPADTKAATGTSAPAAGGVGTVIVGVERGDVWGVAVRDEGSCYRLNSGRIAKKSTRGAKWRWLQDADAAAVAAVAAVAAAARPAPSSIVRFFPISQYLIEPASVVWVLLCGCKLPRA